MKIEDARQSNHPGYDTGQTAAETGAARTERGVCWLVQDARGIINAKQWFLKTIRLKHLVLDASNAMHCTPEFMKIRLEDWVNSLEWTG